MAGLLGVPGLDGYRAAMQDNQSRDMNTVGLMQGVLGLQSGLLDQQMQPLKIEQLKMQLERQRANQQMIQRIMGGGQAQGVMPSATDALTQGAAQGDVGPTVSNAARMAQPQQGQPQGNGLELPPMIQAALLSGDPGLEKWAQAQAQQFKPTDKIREAISLGFRPGSPEFNAHVGTTYSNGLALQTQPGGGVGLTSGYLNAMGELEKTKERAKAEFASPIKVQALINGKSMEISLAPLEYKKYTETGEIPARFGSSTGVSPKTGDRSFFDSQYQNTPQDQAARDAGAQRVMQRENQGGAIPTNTVIGMGQVPEIQAASNKAAEGHATRALEMEPKIPQLKGTLRRLDTLERLTSDDKTYAAKGAQVKAELGSLAEAFGIKVNVDKTANTEQYIAQLAELLKERLASKDYGSGTGISNLDLATAGKPLPDVANTSTGRIAIIKAIKADTERALTDAQALRDYFQKNKTLDGFTYPSETEQTQQQTASKQPAGGLPSIGQRISGYEYLGGDPKQRSSWRPTGASGGF